MEKRQIEIEANTRKAADQLEKLVDILGNMDNQLDEVQDNTEKTRKSMLGFGSLFKIGGIFSLAEKALSFVVDAFKETQFGADALAIAQEVVSRAFKDFFEFIFGNGDKIIGFFKKIFDDPVASMKSFWQAFKANIQERFESFLDTLGFLADAVKKVFEGDFAGALDSVKQAGKESIDVLTGVNDSFDKGKKFVEENTDAVINYGKSLVKAATDSVKLQKKAQLLEAQQQGLIESYDLQAEKLRQVRDDETKSVEERIKANNQLKTVLLEQKAEMLKNAQAIKDAAQARFDATGKLEDEVALRQASNELTAVEAQVTGFMAEQLSNENSLRKEKIDLMNEISLIGKTEFDKQRSEAEQVLEQQKQLINTQITNEEEKNAALLQAEKEYRKTLQDIGVEEFEREQAITEAKIDLAGQALGALQGLAKEGSDASKALAVGQAVLDAYKSIQATFANASANPSSILFPGYPYVQAGIAAVNAFATVRKITAVDPMRTTTPTAPTQRGASQPSFNIVGASPENQLAQALSERESKPVRAYVVSQEVSNQQALDRNVQQTATLG